MKPVHLLGTTLAALIAFAIPVANANPIVGGYTANTLPANDDSSTGAVSLGFSFNYFGTTYTNTYVNNNGNITFAGPQGAYTPFGLTTPLGNPIIAPFFADVYTFGSSGVVTYESKASGVGGHTTFGVEWPAVDYFSDTTASKTNTFELLLVDRSDIAPGDADIYFNYGSMQWETGNASGGTNGLGGACAHVGFSNGSGTAGTNYEVPGSGVCGALINGGSNQLQTATNDGVPGQYLFTVRNGAVLVNTPEPASLVLLSAGLFGLGMARRRRR